MKKHQILSLSHPKSKEVDLILQDSKLNTDNFKPIMKILSMDDILDISILTINKHSEFMYAATISRSYFLKYLNSNAWQNDFSIDLTQHHQFYTIDYGDKNTKYYSPHINHLVTITMDRFFLDRKDRFMFDIPRTIYNNLNHNEKLFLYKKLDSAVNILYSYIKFHNLFISLDKNFQTEFYDILDLPENLEEILKKFKISKTNFIYILYLATGCTAKEIAQRMEKSYKSVQHQILVLCKKFNIQSKSQLEKISRLISLQITYKNNLINL
ncbi:MAG: helix-turn-helix domain-containing protein [Gammaproteobacteria bacterium]|nr:MAG: helix-turn-helix domain-containing protein [Gammaproteobacteria bacterium]UTW43924.1 response regulator transcription factor [bacterium SCSIO 12844]